jgi:ATP adenylyltransferase
MAEYNANLWAPWRMEYIRSLGQQQIEEGCFLCRYWASPGDDLANHVVWRTPHIFVVMNRFPYTNGHLLVALAAHKAEMDELSEPELCELSAGIRDAIRLLRNTIKPQGFNIGYNVGHCAGAGLPDHLHAHVVPRWSGDTNFMAVLGDVRVVPDSLDALHAELHASSKVLGLTGVSGCSKPT